MPWQAVASAATITVTLAVAMAVANTVTSVPKVVTRALAIAVSMYGCGHE